MERQAHIPPIADFPQLRLGFLASHNGTDMRAIIADIETGNLDATAAAVSGNNKYSPALQWAREKGIPAQHFNRHTSENISQDMYDFLIEHHANLIICSGFMQLIGPELYERILTLNVHPADARKYGGQGMYGDRVHETVLATKETLTRPTVHAVTAHYDTGPVLATHELEILPGDTPTTLRQRVQPAEIIMYQGVLSTLSQGVSIEDIIVNPLTFPLLHP